MSDELCFLSASEALAAFRRRALSPVELMEAVLARCDAVNPDVNALTAIHAEDALSQAHEAEAVYMRRHREPRALEGVPVAVKDLHPVAGKRTTMGSRIYADFVPDWTLPTVGRLLDAGAVLHVQTTTSELGYSGVVRTKLWGTTRNPWNLAYGPAGSSGGAGVAVATGMTPIADGSDGGGSIRNPASACGVVGYKPPLGRNPVGRDHPFETLVQYGPLARTVTDAALAQNVMSGPSANDALTQRSSLTLPATYEGVRGWKVAYTLDYGYFQLDDDVRRNTLAAVEAFAELGCQVEEVEIGWDRSVRDAWMTHWEAMFAAGAADLVDRRDELEPVLAGVLTRGIELRATRYFEALAKRGEMYATLGPLLDEYRVLLAPTLAIPAPLATARDDDPEFAIGGVRVDAYLGWQLTYPFNLISQIPAISVPSGFSRHGVPTGLHIVARTFDDRTVFQAAAAFERARPWRQHRPAL